MVTTGQNDSMYAGNGRTLRYTVTDQDTDGSPPVDLTPFTVKWAISRLNTAGNFLTTPVLEKKSSDVSQLDKTDPTNGVCEVYLVPADTSALSGDFYVELEIFAPGGAGLVVSTGTLTINRNVVNT